MKKLLSFLAAGALALGLIGCSGDLHDVKASPLGVVGFDSGTDNIVVLMTMDNDNGSEQSLKFTWSSDATVTSATGTLFNVQEGWGKASGVQFKIILPEGIDAEGKPNWAYDRSYSDTMAYIEPGENYLALFPRGENGYSGAEGQNITISGLADGADYTLKALYDSSTGKVQVKVEGEASDPTQFRIVANDENSKNFPAKDKDGKDTTYSMSKAGDVYTYQFIAVADEDIVFSIKNDLLGTMASASTLSVKKDFEYKITFTKKAGETGTYKSERINLLKNASLQSNREHDYDFYEELKFSTDNMVAFKSTGSSFKFYLNRDSTGLMAWDKGAADISNINDSVTLRYVDNRNVNGDKDFKATQIAPLTMPAFTKDVYYGLVFETNNDSVSIDATVKENTPLTGIEKVFIGGGVSDDEFSVEPIETMIHMYEMTKESDGSFSIEFTFSGNDGWGGGDSAHMVTIFGGTAAPSGWGDQIRFGNGTIKSGGDDGLIVRHNENIKLDGLEKGKKYKLTFHDAGELFTLLKLEEVQ